MIKRILIGDEAQLTLQVNDLLLYKESFSVTRGGKKIQLTPREFNLLEYLMYNKGKVLARDMILDKVWLYSEDVQTRVVDVYMGYLRKKIDSGYSKKLIYSIRGTGYMIKE